MAYILRLRKILPLPLEPFDRLHTGGRASGLFCCKEKALPRGNRNQGRDWKCSPEHEP